MAVDLRALWDSCEVEVGQPGEDADRLFWQMVQRLARTDLCAYGLWVHGQHSEVLRALALSRHAHIWAEALEAHAQTLFICAPEQGKTTFMRWHLEQWMGQQTEAAYADRGARSPSALVIMNTATQAEKQCMAIAITIESNRAYHQLFPHVRPNKAQGWTKDTLFLHRPNTGTAQPDPSLQATGIFGPIQGSRVGLAVVDDPTDQQDARSDRTLDNQKEWHQGVLDDRVLEDGLKRDVMTRWSRKDIPQMLMAAEDSPWHVTVLPAINQAGLHQMPVPLFPETYPEYPWGKALWPELWPMERLEKKRKEKQLVNTGLFQLAYLCEPALAEGNLFRREWLQHGTPPRLMEMAA